MANVKTITTTTTEIAVEFSATYQFMWFRNFGENDCYICEHSGIVANADDVTLLKAGEVAMLILPQTPAQSKAYIKAADGSNTVEVHAQNSAFCPFKVKAKGGDETEVVSLTATENKTYTAPTGTAYSPVVVNVPTATLGTKTITQDGTYNASSDNLDGYSSVTVDTAYHLPDGYTQLDYVEMPSSGQAGFVVSSYSLGAYDVHECKTMPYEVENESAFAGIETSSTLEFYYADGYADVYASYAAPVINLIGKQAAETGNIYYHRAMKDRIASYDFTIGYYRYGSYSFRGRIYYYKIYQTTNKSEGIELIYNFIPCVRVADGKVGMYDTVNDTFYSSTTGTEFVAPSE